MSGYWCSHAEAVKPSLHGPGYDCEPAFGLKYDSDSPARVIDFADIEVAKSEELRCENVLYMNVIIFLMAISQFGHTPAMQQNLQWTWLSQDRDPSSQH